MKKIVLVFLLSQSLILSAFARHGEDPCKYILEVCERSGFIYGEVGIGKGLWRDCVNPIIQGTQPNNLASGMALPSVPAQVVADCKKEQPRFGEGKVGK
jgi:hypothetical protein